MGEDECPLAIAEYLRQAESLARVGRVLDCRVAGDHNNTDVGCARYRVLDPDGPVLGHITGRDCIHQLTFRVVVALVQDRRWVVVHIGL